MKLRILLCSLCLALSLAQLELPPSPSILHLDRHNLDQALQDVSKPWFILVCRRFTPECEKTWPVWERLGQECGDAYHIAALGGDMNCGAIRRLSAGPSPSLFFSQDGASFIDYYWPRDFDSLVDFMTQGYRKIPRSRYHTLEVASGWTYLYLGALQILNVLEREVDELAARVGMSAIPSQAKLGGLLLATLSIALLLLYQICLCLFNSHGGPEFSFKPKTP